MTVIAWDGKTLAADKRGTYGGMICTVTKIKRIGRVLVGGSGEFPFVLAMFDWIERGRNAQDFPLAQSSKEDWQSILVVEIDGATSIYERTPYPVKYEQSHIAIGSGREYARAVMHMGFSAEHAVRIASELDCSCGNGIDLLQL